jgi:hypothetical protein
MVRFVWSHLWRATDAHAVAAGFGRVHKSTSNVFVLRRLANENASGDGSGPSARAMPIID